MAPFAGPLTYSTYDLYTGKYLGHLPLTQVTFGDQLNNPGQFSGQLDIASSAVQALAPIATTMPGRTVLIVDYQGAVIWSGIIWTRNYDFSTSQTNRNLTINATAMWSYFQQRNQATDYSSPPYSGSTGLSSEMAIWDATSAYSDSNFVWDPMLIAWQVISDAMSASYGNPLGGLGILANSYSTTAAYLASGTQTPLGDFVSVSYPYTSIQSVHTIVSQLASNGLDVGFDFGLDVQYSGAPGSVLVGTINLSYPRRGRTYANNNLVLNCGQALSYSFPEDATQMANVIYEQGISSSLIVSENLYPLQQGYALVEKTISRANITNANILNILTFLGVSDLYLFSYPVVTPTVTMDMFSSSVPLGSFITGDDVRLIVPTTDGAGHVWDPRFPTGLDQEWRITGYSAQVQDEGESTIQFQLTQPPGLVALDPWL